MNKLSPLIRYAPIGGGILSILAFWLTGQHYGVPGIILILATLFLFATIIIFWKSIRTVLGETRLAGADVYAAFSSGTEHEQKQATLRALKDLEFERSVGKISEEDYQLLLTKYRTEAKRLLRLIDEQSSPKRQKTEKIVAQYIKKVGLAETSQNSSVAPVSKRPSQNHTCPNCKTENDPDAVFCKKCGTRQREDES